jgi:hypothetical protein
MWFWRIWEALFGEERSTKGSTEFHDGLGVSHVRAAYGKRPKDVHMILNKHEWIKSQHARGRYVIQDTQIKIGKQLRGVPKLRNVEESTLYKKNPHIFVSNRGHQSSLSCDTNNRDA